MQGISKISCDESSKNFLASSLQMIEKRSMTIRVRESLADSADGTPELASASESSNDSGKQPEVCFG
jgi:hypothetical protein